MADYLTTDTELKSIADAIRTKGGTSDSLVYPDGFVTAIGNISGGGGDTSWELLDTISITENIVTISSTLPKACTEVTLYFTGIKTAANAQLVVEANGCAVGSANNFVTTNAKYIETRMELLTGQGRIRRTDIDHATYGWWQSGNLTSRLGDTDISGITEIRVYTANAVGVAFTAGTIYIYGR